MHLSLSEISSRVNVTSEEAVALALAAADECDEYSSDETRVGLPAPNEIRFDDRGRLWFSAAGSAATDRERVKQVATLLQALLSLDHRSEGHFRSQAPGALLVLIARGAGQIDLPALSFAAFRDALRRFGAPDPTTLAAVYRRAIASHAAAATPTAGTPLRPPRQHQGRSGLRITRGQALAASLVVAVLGFTSVWIFKEASIFKEKEARVRVVHERIPVVQATPGAESPRVSTPRPANQPLVTAVLLLSPAVVGADAFSPSFTEHGRELLFHRGRSRSALMRASFDDRGRPALVTVLRDGAANFHAAQSPDGNWLAYDSDRDGTRGVYVAGSDARDPRKLSGDGYAAVPTWSPDGRRLAFVKAETRHPRVWNVWVADLDAQTLSRVSRHSVGQAWGASWFPGGARIAYSVENRLVIADLRSGTTRVLESPRHGRLVRTPAVSPDGRWIVFQVHRDGAWLFDVAAGRMRRVLDDATAEEFAWSPDSRRVIYHARRNGAWSLWQFALDPAA